MNLVPGNPPGDQATGEFRSATDSMMTSLRRRQRACWNLISCLRSARSGLALKEPIVELKVEDDWPAKLCSEALRQRARAGHDRREESARVGGKAFRAMRWFAPKGENDGRGQQRLPLPPATSDLPCLRGRRLSQAWTPTSPVGGSAAVQLSWTSRMAMLNMPAGSPPNALFDYRGFRALPPAPGRVSSPRANSSILVAEKFRHVRDWNAQI